MGNPVSIESSSEDISDYVVTSDSEDVSEYQPSTTEEETTTSDDTMTDDSTCEETPEKRLPCQSPIKHYITRAQARKMKHRKK